MTTQPAAMRIVTEGAIASMAVPSTWADRMQTEEGEGAKYTRQFVCDANSAVQVCIYYRGFPIANSAAKNLLEVLARPEHDLSEQEQEALDELLGNANEPGYFSMKRLCTRDVSGRRVVFADGVWENGGNQSWLLMIPASDDCRVVQEVWLMAPSEQFGEYVELFDYILDSVSWT
jgi:hypothetical protein